MNAPQLIRALGTAAKLTGQADRQAELVALETRASLDDVLDLLDEISVAVDAARPARARELRPRVGRAPSEHAPRILQLASAGHRDPEIANKLGISVAAVRGIRRRAGVAGGPPTPARSGWEDCVREGLDRRLTNAQIAAENGWTVRTAQQHVFVVQTAEMERVVRYLAAELGAADPAALLDEIERRHPDVAADLARRRHGALRWITRFLARLG